MSAVTIAQKTLLCPTAPPTNDYHIFFKILKEEYDIPDTVDEMVEKFGNHFPKTSKKKMTPPPEERQGAYNEHLCDARVWKEKPKSGGLGYDNIQCSSKKVEGYGCLCKKHFKLMDEGKLWLGKVTEDRPENPMHPTAGLKMWCTDADGNEVVKEKKARKSPPKEKKEKKVRKPRKKKSDVDVAEGLSIEELRAIIAKKKDEVEETPSPPKDDVEETPSPPKDDVEVDEKKDDVEVDEKKDEVEENDGLETITVDGVEYQHNTDDHTLINCDTYEEVGTWNTETEKIDFYDDE